MAKLSIGEEVKFVESLTDEIEQFNKLVNPDKRISIKTNVNALHLDWTIPEEYLKLDIRSYLVDKLYGLPEIDDEKELIVRAKRVAQEIKMYEERNLTDVLRVLIYVINTLNRNNVVWGVGRGSSVSSYVLYLIGVHDVDSVKYDLDIEDFMH